jgi:hypothetical protein
LKSDVVPKKDAVAEAAVGTMLTDAKAVVARTADAEAVAARMADADAEAAVATTTTYVEAAVTGGVALVGGGGGPPPPTIFILLDYSAVVLFVALPILFIFILPVDCNFLIVLQIFTFRIMSQLKTRKNNLQKAALSSRSQKIHFFRNLQKVTNNGWVTVLGH